MAAAGAVAYGAGSLLTILGKLTRKGVKLAQEAKLDPTKIQRETIAGNLEVLPQAEQLAEKMEAGQQERTLKRLRQFVPVEQYTDAANKLIKAYQSGEIPADDIARLNRQLAGTALAKGYAGSGFHLSQSARNLLQTSQQRQLQGYAMAQNWINFARSTLMGPSVDVSGFFFSPTQRAQIEWQNEQARFQRDTQQGLINQQQHWRTIVGDEMVEAGGTLKSIGSFGMGGGMGGQSGAMANMSALRGTRGLPSNASSLNPAQAQEWNRYWQYYQPGVQNPWE